MQASQVNDGFRPPFLEWYCTYFQHGIGYNDVVDGREHLLRVMNAGLTDAIESRWSYRRKDDMMKKKDGYTKDLPRKLYTFFIGYNDTGAPSFAKFARSIGTTLNDLEGYRKHKEFERAYRECSEIRRDYLIDNGLTKRFDSSFTKFLLSSEYRMGEEKLTDEEKNVCVTLEVIGNEN